METRYATRLLTDRPTGVGYLLKDRVADVAGIFPKLGLPPSDGDNRRVLSVLRHLGA